MRIELTTFQAIQSISDVEASVIEMYVQGEQDSQPHTQRVSWQELECIQAMVSGQHANALGVFVHDYFVHWHCCVELGSHT